MRAPPNCLPLIPTDTLQAAYFVVSRVFLILGRFLFFALLLFVFFLAFVHVHHHVLSISDSA